jgi:uncharacterized protein (TIGR04255 family)
MAAPPGKFNKPPLLEVYCEFLFEPGEGKSWDGLRIGDFMRAIGSDYTQRRMMHLGGGRARLHDEEEIDWDDSDPGEPLPLFQFKTDDGTTALQVGENLLVVNQLPPYYGWSRFSPRVLNALACYRDAWKPGRIDQVLLHYVDRVFIPEPNFEFRDFFNLYPVLPAGFIKPYTNLSLLFDLEGCGKGDVLSVALQQDASADPDGISFLLNWDYSSTEPVELDPELAEIREWLESAHGCCSDHFNALFTDRGLALFEPDGGS